MADYSNITDHPDYQEIVAKIVTGTSVKDISNWLKIKYPADDHKHLHLSQKSLQDFADKHVDLEATLKRDILTVKSPENGDMKIAGSLLNNKTYRERLTQLADDKVDIKRRLQEMVLVGMERLEQVYDRIQENPTNMKHDYVLLKWFEQMVNLYEKVNKIVNEAPDQVIHHNITVQAVEQHTAILQEAVRETLMQMDHEMASLFIDLLNKKLQNLKAPSLPQEMTMVELLNEVKKAEVLLPKGET